jgi:tRNA-modifying protein YgfZ
VVGRAGLTAVAGRCRVAGDLLLVSRPGGMDICGPVGAVQEAVQALLEGGADQGNEADLEDWRVAHGEPTWGREVRPPHLPEELGLLPTHVHLAKGCYPGQEAVARMWMLGRPRRRLAVVAVEGAVTAGWRAGAGRELVELTSVAADGTRALAFVPAGADVGATFEAEDGDGAVVTVVRLVGDDVVPPGHDPAVTRRRDRR